MHHHHHGHGQELPRTSGYHGQAPPMPDRPSADFILLDPRKIEFSREGTQLRMKGPGEEPDRPVRIVRLFPMADPEDWISVLDEKGAEIGILRHVSALEDAPRRLIREELRRQYIVPRIERIDSCVERFDLVTFDVQTDRGPRTFSVRNLRETVLVPSPGRVILTDTDGNRYDIPNLAGLDARSRAHMEQFF